MQNYILFHATTTDEIYECSYSLLKYLDIYNLKPPADHAIVIYTNKPALLESYGTFFNNFELRDVMADEHGSTLKTKPDVIKGFSETHKGNILYLGRATYPVKELSMLFSNMAKGTVYRNWQKAERNSPGAEKENLSVLGFNNTSKRSMSSLLGEADAKHASGFIEEYEDLKEFRILLRNFFTRNQEESIPNQVKLIHHINARQIQDQKKKYQQLPFYIRMMKKLLGKGWDISQYAGRL